MLNATSKCSGLTVMGKNNDIDCASVVHHLSSDSEGGTSKAHMATPIVEEWTQEPERVMQFSSVATRFVSTPTSVSTQPVSDQDTSSPNWHDLPMHDGPPTESITTSIDLVTKETISLPCPNLDGESDMGQESSVSSIDRSLDSDSDTAEGTSMATSEPINAFFSSKLSMISSRPALKAVSNNFKDTLSYVDDNDDSEVFADMIYANEVYRDSNKCRPRSIRFSDEKEGTTLATIHLIPWTEDDDANWLPRLERCRMEL